MNEEPQNQWAKERAKKACQRLGDIARKEGVTHESLSIKTGFTRPGVTRFFSGAFSPRMDIVLTVLEAVNELSGKNYTLDDIDVQQED